MQTQYQFQTADKIIAGAYRFEQLAVELQKTIHAHRVLIVTQPSMVNKSQFETMKHNLSDNQIEFDFTVSIQPEPTIANIENTFEETVRGKNWDAIIGIGGGSVLDAVKILAVLNDESQSIEEMLENGVQSKGLPTILIPTTSGTGSEVTPNAIVTIPDQQLKVGIVSPYFLPELVIIDPVLTLTLPKEITAATGMDAFTHALESYISIKANPISDMFALEAIRRISKSIVPTYLDGSSLEDRENLLIGSMYGGMALTSAGTAAVHALAYPLGGTFHITHGVANSMLLPHVMDVNQEAITTKLVNVAEAMNLPKLQNDEATASSVVEEIKRLTNKLHIPQDLQSFGVKEQDIKALAEAAFNVKRLLNNNPKPLNIPEIENIYRKLIEV
ncbi:iron-containing alcohol dehydrogenase [Geomicrobium sp. JCM 19038]|uniref:iron-containing alcohol dehydrogenase n=1 Tax=Geomicrobium sp. JCM 19038 TaxID=1460635 RepID=UPI00045F1900|nr:iron-containing alcohol dehydrogenase [Geomicrobium sp. JCM 19038]GAK09847.1 alcohol dehydrogenase [Geomicrobium sp. JCM 19038]